MGVKGWGIEGKEVWGQSNNGTLIMTESACGSS